MTQDFLNPSCDTELLGLLVRAFFFVYVSVTMDHTDATNRVPAKGSFAYPLSFRRVIAIMKDSFPSGRFEKSGVIE
ncbi:hypothetical protein DT065_00655 [Salicibibacter kimchii]|uniref:Uncharacterized protein n=1 Tax=Salicibibacter kimchii TaxID=2099786 RepID=A0A345BUP1_9BACI|nr:hypothetical protein DT065_00655 [Salicibibacter kimchii]